MFEATTLPSAQTITAQWYTKSEAAPRYAYWYVGSSGAQILGGFISFGFQHVDGGKLSGWRTMFLVFGVATVGVGLAVLWFVPDTPMKASFLSDEEKVGLLMHVQKNQTGIRNQKFKREEIREAVQDPQIWIFGIATISVSTLFLSSSLLLLHGGLYTAVDTCLACLLKRYNNNIFRNPHPQHGLHT